MGQWLDDGACGANESGNVHGRSSVEIWRTRSPFSFCRNTLVLAPYSVRGTIVSLSFPFFLYTVYTIKYSLPRFRAGQRLFPPLGPVGPYKTKRSSLLSICITDLVPGKE